MIAGHNDINMKSYKIVYLRTVYYSFLPMYIDGLRNPEIGLDSY